MNRWVKRGAVGIAGITSAGVCGLLGFVWSADPTFPEVPAPAISASTDPAVIVEGAYLVHAVAHCSECHGAREAGDHSPKKGHPPLTGGQPITTPFGVFYPPNLTPDATGIAGYTDAELARVIRHGVRRGDHLAPFMKVAIGPMSDADLTAIVSFLRTLPPIRREVPASSPNLLGHALFAFGLFQPGFKEIPAYTAPSDEPSAARGAYLARGPASCVSCHTASDPMADMAYVVPEFSGGGEHPSQDDPTKAYVPPNLTPGGPIGGWTEDHFVARFRQGRAWPDTIMPWESYGQLTDADLRSLYRFLHGLTPIAGGDGPSLRPIGT
jgi:mono/diheme cytochrome c family protein